jgi:CheY-like chemotaxis protein
MDIPNQPPQEPVRVVVVDDDRDGAATMAALLECEGYAVRMAHDGLHALPTIEQWQPRCVLLDIDLPGLDGYDIARRLRRSHPDHGMLLIATSGWTRPEDRETAAVCGFDHFLAKPVDVDALLALLPRP